VKKITPALLLALAACGSPEAKLTESQEYYAGRAVSAVVLKKYRLVDNDALNEYVNLVGYTVALASDRPDLKKGYTFAVLDSDEPNAIAGPSGFIFITRGLLVLLENEDELACVLAHEVGHINRKHPELALQKSIDDGKWMKAADTAAGVASFGLGLLGRGQDANRVETARQNFGPFISNMVDSLVTKGFERDQEFEADLCGLDYVCREGVGYDPNALVAVLTRLANNPTKNSYGWLHGSTHPEPGDRRDKAAAYIKEKGLKGTTDPARTQRFKDAVKELKK
jgi:predicted Zn-dependent protease